MFLQKILNRFRLNLTTVPFPLIKYRNSLCGDAPTVAPQFAFPHVQRNVTLLCLCLLHDPKLPAIQL
jgi:hypothetical protein